MVNNKIEKVERSNTSPVELDILDLGTEANLKIESDPMEDNHNFDEAKAREDLKAVFEDKTTVTSEENKERTARLAERKLSIILWRIFNLSERDITTQLQEELRLAYDKYCREANGQEIERKINIFEREGKEYYVAKTDGKLPQPEKKVLRWIFGSDFLGWSKTGNIALVKDGSPKLVERYITEHELFHCRDKWHSKNRYADYIVREIRAHLAVDFKDPIGYMATNFYNFGRSIKDFFK